MSSEAGHAVVRVARARSLASRREGVARVESLESVALPRERQLLDLRKKETTCNSQQQRLRTSELNDTHMQEVVFAVLLLDSTEFVRRQQSKSDVRRDFLGDYMHRLPEHDLQRYLAINSVRLLGDVKQYEGDALS